MCISSTTLRVSRPSTEIWHLPCLSDQASGTAVRAGYVDAVVAKDLPDLDGWKAYIAGPPPMVEAVMVVATNRRLRVEDMHADVFFTPDEPLASAAAG